MKRVGNLMQEMGFRPEAPQATKEAFIKHLLRAAEGIHVQTPTEKKIIQENPETIRDLPRREEQLSFEFMKTGTDQTKD